MKRTTNKAHQQSTSFELPSFDKPSDSNSSAHLNWSFPNISGTGDLCCFMADGYFDAAERLLESYIANNSIHKADVGIFPVIHLVTHGVELYLKSFITLFERHEAIGYGKDAEEKIRGNHDIRQLCKTAIARVKNSDHKNQEPQRALESVLDFINHICPKNCDPTFFRYPVDKDGKRQFYASRREKDNIAISLSEFFQCVKSIHAWLKQYTSFWLSNEIIFQTSSSNK
jgi:hypothetical protein